MPDAQLALDRSGPVDEHDPPRARDRLRTDRAVARGAAVPRAERALDGRQQRIGVEGARHDEVRAGRPRARGMEGPDVVDAQPLDRLRATGRQAPVRRGGGVEMLEEPLVGQATRIGARLHDVGEALGFEPLEFAWVEAGLEDHLRQEGEAVDEMFGHGLERSSGAVPARLAADLDSEPLGRLGEGVGVEASRAGDEQLRGERRDAALHLGLGRRPGVHEEVDVHERAIGQRDEPEGQPVCQPSALEGREVVGARRPGDRAKRVDGRHAVTSWLSAAASVSDAVSSAAGPSGGSTADSAGR